MKIIDISQLLSSRIHVWPGNPPFALEPVQSIAGGDSANVSRLVLGSHTGTHVDAPRHFFAEGVGVDELALAQLIGPCRVVDTGGTRNITAADLQRAVGPIAPERLLLKTGNGRLWQQPGFSTEFAHLTADAAQWVVTAGVRLVGIDYLSIEEYHKPGAPAHHALLGAGVIVIEGLDLAAVAPGTYELICLPLRIAGADGAPVRAVLRDLP
ncbi:MAG TPA: cyclase family protein [Vicinamibacterales bacterium]|nr:cyclase family protein [Vicinamibacterales bacterium]